MKASSPDSGAGAGCRRAERPPSRVPDHWLEVASSASFHWAPRSPDLVGRLQTSRPGRSRPTPPPNGGHSSRPLTLISDSRSSSDANSSARQLATKSARRPACSVSRHTIDMLQNPTSIPTPVAGWRSSQTPRSRSHEVDIPLPTRRWGTADSRQPGPVWTAEDTCGTCESTGPSPRTCSASSSCRRPRTARDAPDAIRRGSEAGA